MFFENRELDSEESFSEKTKKDNDLIHLIRKLGHNMDKKSKILWDISAMEKYLKDNMVHRKLRWDIPINDGLMAEEDIEE